MGDSRTGIRDAKACAGLGTTGCVGRSALLRADGALILVTFGVLMRSRKVIFKRLGRDGERVAQPTRTRRSLVTFRLCECAAPPQGVSDTAEDEGAVLWVSIAWHYGRWRCRSSSARRYSVDGLTGPSSRDEDVGSSFASSSPHSSFAHQ